MQKPHVKNVHYLQSVCNFKNNNVFLNKERMPEHQSIRACVSHHVRYFSTVLASRIVYIYPYSLFHSFPATRLITTDTVISVPTTKATVVSAGRSGEPRGGIDTLTLIRARHRGGTWQTNQSHSPLSYLAPDTVTSFPSSSQFPTLIRSFSASPTRTTLFYLASVRELPFRSLAFSSDRLSNPFMIIYLYVYVYMYIALFFDIYLIIYKL